MAPRTDSGEPDRTDSGHTPDPTDQPKPKGRRPEGSSPRPEAAPTPTNTPTGANSSAPAAPSGEQGEQGEQDGQEEQERQGEKGQQGQDAEGVAQDAADSPAGPDTAPDTSASTDPAPASDLDPRVAAVRRAGAAGRRWRSLQLGACAALLAVALTGGAIAIGALKDGSAAPVATASAVSPGLLNSGDIDSAITALQAHLRAQPRDFGSWATLGLAYVEQARTKGDPSRYPQAEKAFTKSLELSAGNGQALAGRAALAAARHDFPGALKYADQVLKDNPYNERALCTRIDALVELGRYDEALTAAETADTRRPGIPVFTRYAYVQELRGDVTTARRVLEQALAGSTAKGDIAYVASQLGQLAWNQGDYETALTDYARALTADEDYLPALEGRAKAQAASGQQADAIKGLESVVARYPLPAPLVELGELYEARGADGDRMKAADQYALVDAWTALARANGVNADLDTALAAADHGDKRAALRAARAEWDRRETVHTADALAWALHVNGRDAEALPYARKATATGYRNASFLYHRGVIESATGDKRNARTHLTKALALNPGFSPLGARTARAALKTLEANQ
ncbi:tetratricopeptide repeat protein [Streptomyces niveiscabiei]|uniref:tetratricopeptide repeat protein n=1 Tax=Streptomyces niveiscabiei TaxID=164115 RepID=UPI0029B2A072|nr:tetratricopeptide repeat protein [Streptomyces niveiscabiei]MDX3386887.1 tetratricopeptide repeat protein [Streptomyces niveiscabiei]